MDTILDQKDFMWKLYFTRKTLTHDILINLISEIIRAMYNFR